jgi:hypothetical protein
MAVICHDEPDSDHPYPGARTCSGLATCIWRYRTSRVALRGAIGTGTSQAQIGVESAHLID